MKSVFYFEVKVITLRLDNCFRSLVSVVGASPKADVAKMKVGVAISMGKSSLELKFLKVFRRQRKVHVEVRGFKFFM